MYSKEKADRVRLGFGIEEFDNEGRYVELSFKNFILISVYFPSGSSSDERQQAKFRFLEVFLPHLRELKKPEKKFSFAETSTLLTKKSISRIGKEI